MNIELDEVVVQDVSDAALELAAGGALGVSTQVNKNNSYCFLNSAYVPIYFSKLSGQK